MPNGAKKFFNSFIYRSLHKLGNKTDGLAIEPNKCLDDSPHGART